MHSEVTEVTCKLCGRKGAEREGGRIPAGWRTYNNSTARGPICPVCWGPNATVAEVESNED